MIGPKTMRETWRKVGGRGRSSRCLERLARKRKECGNLMVRVI
jgi:hypothetical protein